MFRKWISENRLEDYDFSGKIFPKACERDFWESKYDTELVSNAEKLLGCDWPIIRATTYMEFFKSGDRMSQQVPHYKRRDTLATLLIGEIMEYKGRFLPDIVDGIFAICEETYWGVSAHSLPLIHKEAENIPDITNHVIDLFAAETAELLSVTYYMLYDELYDFCPEILDRIQYELYTRIMHPYTTRKDYWWMGYGIGPVNNWNPWIISNILTVFLMVPSTKTEFNNAVKKMLFEIDAYYMSIQSDGGCDEGSSYWRMAGGKLFEFCDLLYLATNGKINFFNDEKIQNIGKYEYRCYIGNGYFVNFADGAPRLSPDFSYILLMYGKRIGDQKLSSLAKELLKANDKKTSDSLQQIKRAINNIIYKKEINAQPDFVSDESCILENLENAYVRNGNWYYAAKGGTNKENHNHNDVGSFIIYYENQPLLIDPSCGVYTRKTFSSRRYEIWTMQSGWHNLPVINGCEQLSEYDVGGENAKADNFALSGKNVSVSFAAAYPEKAEINRLTREISALEDVIEICDSFSFKKDSNTVCEHFIVANDVKLENNLVIIADKFIIETDSDCVFSCDSVDFENDANLTRYWKTDRLNRIKCSFTTQKDKKIRFTVRKI